MRRTAFEECRLETQRARGDSRDLHDVMAGWDCGTRRRAVRVYTEATTYTGHDHAMAIETQTNTIRKPTPVTPMSLPVSI